MGALDLSESRQLLLPGSFLYVVSCIQICSLRHHFDVPPVSPSFSSFQDRIYLTSYGSFLKPDDYV